MTTHRFRQTLVVCAASHVKRLDFERKADEEDGFANLVSHLALRCFRYVLLCEVTV